jgi:15-cis-phytoene desaturase
LRFTKRRRRPAAKPKARRNRIQAPARGKDLAGEHGFRFFPGFYQHVPDTMKRIPFAGNEHGVFDNLVVAPQAGIAQEKKPLYGFLTHIPQTPLDWGLVFEDWFARSELGLKPGEADYFISRMLDFMSTCTKRRFAKLEYEKWWDYVGAPTRSVQYKKLLAQGMTRSLVAMDAEIANSRTVGSILVQMFMSMTSQSGTMDRVLNAPTSDAWITPWVTYLLQRGVKITLNAAVQRVEFDGTKITGVVIEQPTGATTVTGDYYLAAFPVEVAQIVFAPLAAAAPSLGRIKNLQYAWMNGLVFYLPRDVPDLSWACDLRRLAMGGDLYFAGPVLERDRFVGLRQRKRSRPDLGRYLELDQPRLQGNTEAGQSMHAA